MRKIRRFAPFLASKAYHYISNTIIKHLLLYNLTFNNQTAYSNIAELWMTDLCMSPLAESSCESSVAAALSNDEGVHPDGFQALSSLRLSQRRGEDAANAILKAYGMMEEGVKAGANTVGLGSKVRDK